NYMKFVKEIDQLDIELRNSLREFQGRSFITFNPSLSYFARDYGLEQLTLESGAKEPTPQHMARGPELARKANIGVTYSQTAVYRDHGRGCAEEIKREVVDVKPLRPQWEENLKEMAFTFIENF